MKRTWKWKDRQDLLQQIQALLQTHSWSAIAYILSQQEGADITADSIRGLYKSQHLITLPANRKVTVGLKDVQRGGDNLDNRSQYKTQFEDKGNHAILIKYTEFNPRTVEELLDVCGVDTDVWKVDHYVVNKWDVSMKMGTGNDVQVLTHPNYQIKAWLIRKTPIKHEWPAIKSVSIGKPIARKGKPPRRKIYKALILPDSQNGYRRNIQTGYLDPFHDRRCWSVVAQINEYLMPDVKVYLGDMLDLPMWTDKYLRSPDFYFTTQPALEELFWWMQLMGQTGSEDHYIEGNHEKRLIKAIIANTIESYGLRPANHPEAPAAMSVPNLMSLNELGITYHGDYPNSEYWINDNLRASHFETVRKGSGDSVKAILKETRNSEIGAHTHRLESAHITVHPRKGAITYGVYCCGTLARIDNAVPAGTARHNWQNGFGVVDFTHDGYFHVSLYSINNGQVIFGGKLFRSANTARIAKDISDATGWDYTRKDNNGRC